MRNLKIKDFIAIGLIISALVTELSKNIIAIPLIVLWFILALSENKVRFKEYFFSNKRITVIICLWISISLILYLFGNKFMTSYEIKNIIRIAINLLIFGYYLYYGEKQILKTFLIISMIVLLAICINTVINLIINPSLSRILSTENPEMYDGYIKVKYIGSFGFAYGLIFIIISILGSKIKEERIIEKIVDVFIIATFTITVIYEQFTISILLLVMGIILIVFKSYNIKRMIIIALMLALITLLSMTSIINILDNIAENIEKRDISERLYEISNLLKNADLTKSADIKARLDKDTESIITFFQDPLGFQSQKKIGGHSELLDEYAKYGVIIASISVMVFIEYMKFIKINILKKQNKKNIWFIVEMVYIVYSIINTTMFINTTIMIFFIVPLILKTSEREEKNENIMDS